MIPRFLGFYGLNVLVTLHFHFLHVDKDRQLAMLVLEEIASCKET